MSSTILGDRGFELRGFDAFSSETNDLKIYVWHSALFRQGEKQWNEQYQSFTNDISFAYLSNLQNEQQQTNIYRPQNLYMCICMYNVNIFERAAYGHDPLICLLYAAWKNDDKNKYILPRCVHYLCPS